MQLSAYDARTTLVLDSTALFRPSISTQIPTPVRHSQPLNALAAYDARTTLALDITALGVASPAVGAHLEAWLRQRLSSSCPLSYTPTVSPL